MSEIETGNKFFVGAQGDQVLIMRQCQRLTRHEALNLAAWLVALADRADEFPALLAAVKNT